MLKQVLLPSKGKYSLTIPPSKGTTNPPLRLLAAFNDAYPATTPAYIIQAAGREMWIAATVDEAKAFTIHAADLKRKTTFTWRSAKNKQTPTRRPLPSWVRFPAGTIVHLCQNGMDVPGVDAVVVGAEAQGPRYAFSMGVAFATLWHEVLEQDYTEDGIIAIVEKVRRDYVEG